MNININKDIKISGEYCIQVRDDKGKLKTDVTFTNLIVDQGLKNFPGHGCASGNDMLNWRALYRFRLGSDNATPPSGEQTGLVNEFFAGGSEGPTNTNYTDSATGIRYRKITIARQFGLGEIIGDATEIGISGRLTGGSNAYPAGLSELLISRTLIRDGSGNPMTLELGQYSQLTLIWTAWIKEPEDSVGTITVDGTEYNYTVATRNFTSTSSGSWNATPDWWFACCFAEGKASKTLSTFHWNNESTSTGSSTRGCAQTEFAGENKREMVYTLPAIEDNDRFITSIEYPLVNGHSTPSAGFTITFDNPILIPKFFSIYITLQLNWSQE